MALLAPLAGCWHGFFFLDIIRETYVFAILKDKGIKELCKTGKSLFKYY
jgi:hypothetical protein